MQSFAACILTSKFLQVGIIVFCGSGQCPNYPKLEVGNILAINEKKSLTTAFVFYYDAKHIVLVFVLLTLDKSVPTGSFVLLISCWFLNL